MTDFSSPDWMKIESFTGETIYYNDRQHEYCSETGLKLMGGSKYASLMLPEFPKSILKATAKKLGFTEEDLDAVWKSKGNTSAMFGKAVHSVLEHFFKYRDYGKYAIPKHPFLAQMVAGFPLRDADVLPEVFVSDSERGMCGQIDALVRGADSYIVADYKTDAEIKRNLVKHAHQLNFYADILVKKGVRVSGLSVFNYTDRWEEYKLELQPIDERKIAEHVKNARRG